MTRSYTPLLGQTLVAALGKTLKCEPRLLGSLAEGKTSEHDIDIFLPLEKTDNLKERLILFFGGSCEDTDWGGWYFSNTMFGDVDVFFDTKDFDYGTK